MHLHGNLWSLAWVGNDVEIRHVLSSTVSFWWIIWKPVLDTQTEILTQLTNEVIMFIIILSWPFVSNEYAHTGFTAWLFMGPDCPVIRGAIKPGPVVPPFLHITQGPCIKRMIHNPYVCWGTFTRPVTLKWASFCLIMVYSNEVEIIHIEVKIIS